MANEFKHKDPGGELTQAEFIASDGTGHIFDSQAAGDILYASSTTALARLAKGSDDDLLTLSSGAPAWTSSPTLTALTVDDVAVNGKIITMTGSSGDTAVFTVGTDGTLSLVTTDAGGTAADLTIDADGQINIDANDAAGIFLGINGTNQINLVDGVLKPVTDNDVDLGVSGGPEFKDGFFNGTLEADAVTIGGTNVVTGSLVTTLGTVSAGVWNGTAIVKAYIGADAIDGSKIEDDAINSEHYTDGSIDNAHLADDAVNTDEIADNAVTLAKMASGTDGQIITYDASGDPVAVGPGTDGQVLTSTGAGSPPAFEAAGGLSFTAVASASTAIGANTSTQVSTAVMSDDFHYIIWDDSRSTGIGGTMIGSFVQGDESLAATNNANYERSGNGSTTDRILLTTGGGDSVTHVWAVQEIS